jgi:DNA-directed RNA polymerase subunit F
MCADLLPSNEDTVKLIFSKSRQTLREEQVKQILELVQKYI